METVLAPVRYPLSEHSRHTLSEAARIAEQRDAELTILHVNLYQNGERVTRSELKRAVEDELGPLSNTRYVVRRGFLVEETIVEEIAAENADVAVIGHKQLSRWRRTINRLLDDPDIAEYLKERVTCELIVIPPP